MSTKRSAKAKTTKTTRTKTAKGTETARRSTAAAASKQRRRERIREHAAAKRPIDWARLANASRELADWALDVAARSVEDFPEDMARIDSVRNFTHAQLAGVPCAKPSDEDLLFVLGLLITELEVDCGIPGVREAVEREIAMLLDRQYMAPWLDAAPPVEHAPRCPRAARVVLPPRWPFDR